MKLAIVSLCLVSTLIGCVTARSPAVELHVPSSSNYHDLELALDEAEAKWSSSGILSYSYHINCGSVFGGSEYKVTYHNGACHAKYIRDYGMPSTCECNQYSMPQLFAIIRNAITAKYGEISVSFDSECGNVQEFSLRPDASEPDNAWIVVISHFKRS